jgi:hypothetical protein
MAGSRRRPRRSDSRRPDGPKWTAAQAAFRAVQLRDDLLKRFPSNPLAVANEVATYADVIGQWMQIYRDSGIPEREALHLCAVRCGHVDALPATMTPKSLAEMVTREVIQHDVTALRDGEMFVVSPAMHAVTVAAAATVTSDDIASLTDDDLTAPRGFLLLPAIQLLQQPGRAFPDEILALSWMTRTLAPPNRVSKRTAEVSVWIDGNGPVQVPDFIAARRMAAQAGHPFPRLMPLHHSRLILGESPVEDHAEIADMMAQVKAVQPATNDEGVEVGEYHGGLIESGADDWTRAYLFAFIRLCNQQIGVTTPYREMRNADLPPRPTDPVRVTQLRSFSELGHANQQQRREYRHRWVVRMHKVRQWYPGEGVHKIIWRGPYMKGPANAPLLSGERVNALVR